MNKEIKAKWITALRSGEYKQGIGALNKDNKFCCLGVLTDLYIKEKNLAWDESPKGTFSGIEFEGCWSYLPFSVRDWAELENSNPNIKGSTNLANLNDQGKPFEEIADLIDEYL